MKPSFLAPVMAASLALTPSVVEAKKPTQDDAVKLALADGIAQITSQLGACPVTMVDENPHVDSVRMECLNGEIELSNGKGAFELTAHLKDGGIARITLFNIGGVSVLMDTPASRVSFNQRSYDDNSKPTSVKFMGKGIQDELKISDPYQTAWTGIHAATPAFDAYGISIMKNYLLNKAIDDALGKETASELRPR